MSEAQIGSVRDGRQTLLDTLSRRPHHHDDANNNDDVEQQTAAATTA